MAQHVKILGILHIVFGGLCVLGGLIALLVLGGIAGLVGASDQSQDAQTAIPILGGIGGLVFVICLIVGLPGLIGGVGLIQFKAWARILVIVLSALDLLNIPLGTALGIYGFWVLLNRETDQMFARRPLPAMPQYPVLTFSGPTDPCDRRCGASSPSAERASHRAEALARNRGRGCPSRKDPRPDCRDV